MQDDFICCEYCGDKYCSEECADLDDNGCINCKDEVDCEYCIRGQEKSINDTYPFLVELEIGEKESELYINLETRETCENIRILVNYCPVCGRKLKESEDDE